MNPLSNGLSNARFVDGKYPYGRWIARLKNQSGGMIRYILINFILWWILMTEKWRYRIRQKSLFILASETEEWLNEREKRGGSS